MKEQGKNSLILGICGLMFAVAVLGAVGFHFFENPVQPTLTLWDSFWWAMVTVTTIGYGDIFPKTVGGRLIALFLMFGGIGTLGIFTAAIAAYFIRGDGLQLLRLNRFQDHVVICGLGEKGLLLTKAFRARGRDVAIIEDNETNEFAPTARSLGAIVLYGDAREPSMLRSARLNTAQNLIVVCGDDGVNAEVAAHARDLSQQTSDEGAINAKRSNGDRRQTKRVGKRGNRRKRERSGTLVCSAHIINPELWYLLREWEMAERGSFRLQFFNGIDSAARALLDEHPPFELCDTEKTPEDHLLNPPRILIVGGGRLGQSLLVHIARAWREMGLACDVLPGDLPKMKLTLLDKNPGRISEILRMRHPELEKVCELETLEMDCSDPEFHRAAFLWDEGRKCRVERVYVCLTDDALALSAALALNAHLRINKVPIVVAMTQEAGLSSLLRRVREVQPQFQTLYAVGLLERACQPDLVLGGIPEMLARALHDKYVEDQEALGNTREKNPLMAPWDELPEEGRESNRTQALAIGEKLQSIGCDIVPLTDWDAHTFRFSEAEVESMANMEHQRWTSERLAQGWTYGPRDTQRKTNPNLVAWDKLPDGTRDFNRTLVREIPMSLARAGFQVFRMGERDASDEAD